MKRQVITIAAVLLLVLSVAFFVLWVRSYWVTDLVYWNRLDGKGERWIDAVVSQEGRLTHVSFWVPPPPLGNLAAFDTSFHLILYRSTLPQFIVLDRFPRHWVLAIWCATGTAVLLVLGRLGSRTTPGRCRTCSYSLTGNTSGTCPECGKTIPSSTKKPETKAPGPREQGYSRSTPLNDRGMCGAWRVKHGTSDRFG